jgi:integrase
VTLSEPEAARLLSVAANPRDQALLALLLGAGLRAAELVGLDVADVQEDAAFRPVKLVDLDTSASRILA